MPRGRSISKRKTQPDPVYQDVRVARFINYVMVTGKKELARRIVYEALEHASEKLNVKPLDLFGRVLEVVRPEVEVRSRRVGGANYQIPVPVPMGRGDFLAMKWIIHASRGRAGKPMVSKLADELANAYRGEGDAVRKKETTHKMAEANRAFAHFRW